MGVAGQAPPLPKTRSRGPAARFVRRPFAQSSSPKSLSAGAPHDLAHQSICDPSQVFSAALEPDLGRGSESSASINSQMERPGRSILLKIS
jgi:hypothetical protein